MSARKVAAFVIALSQFLLMALRLNAQLPSASDAKLLLPLNVDQVFGAFGTLWVTELALANHSDTPLAVLGYGPDTCPIENCTPPPISPHATIFTGYVRCASPGGRLLYVDRARLGDLDATLRMYETTRGDQSWGATVPIVSEAELFSTPFSLVNVITDSHFQSSLRVYDVDPATPAAVTVNVYAINRLNVSASDVLLRTIQPTFLTTANLFCGSAADIHLWDYEDVVNAGLVRLEIIPTDSRKEYWAFVTVTHNDSQHVTIVTPLQHSGTTPRQRAVRSTAVPRD